MFAAPSLRSGAEKEENYMRVTTKMVNDSAQKAGLPGISNSLLNVMDQGGDENSLLSSLEKSGNAKAAKAVRSLMKDGYDKVENAAGELTKSARQFSEYEKGSDAEKPRASAKSIVKSYNEALKAMGKTNDTLDQYYAKMLKEAASENKGYFSEAGIVIQKDGQLLIDTDKLEKADAQTLINAFGSGSTFNEKASFLGEHIADHASASAGSVTNQYGSNGMINTEYSHKLDYWG